MDRTRKLQSNIQYTKNYKRNNKKKKKINKEHKPHRNNISKACEREKKPTKLTTAPFANIHTNIDKNRLNKYCQQFKITLGIKHTNDNNREIIYGFVLDFDRRIIRTLTY